MKSFSTTNSMDFGEAVYLLSDALLDTASNLKKYVAGISEGLKYTVVPYSIRPTAAASS